MPAHITIVAHDIGPVGGMEIQISHLIAGLLERGRHVTTIARSCELPAHAHHEKITVHVPDGPFPAVYPAFAVAAGAIVARRARGIVHTAGAIIPNPVDVVTCHFCHHAFEALNGPLRARRDTPVHRASARLSAIMSKTGERLVYRPHRVRATVAISDGVRRELEAWFPRLRGTIHTIPHGVDLARFAPNRGLRAQVRRQLGIAPDALVAVFAGGDWARKGLRHAITAVARASRWRLLVVGDGDADDYRAAARAAGAGDRVFFVGPSKVMPAQFAAADVFVLPTTYETFSMVTYEAAAAHLPLLVTRVSGPDQLISDGSNGAFLNDDPSATAKWLIRLEDAELRATMGSAARRAVEPYTWQEAVARHVRLYDVLCLARSDRSRGR